MPNFQLATVAKTLGIEVNDTKLHDGKYDADLTEKIFNIVTQNNG
jgi:DNA polymerase III alpha subunit (gram-positive type)